MINHHHYDTIAYAKSLYNRRRSIEAVHVAESNRNPFEKPLILDIPSPTKYGTIDQKIEQPSLALYKSERKTIIDDKENITQNVDIFHQPKKVSFRKKRKVVAVERQFNNENQIVIDNMRGPGKYNTDRGNNYLDIRKSVTIPKTMRDKREYDSVVLHGQEAIDAINDKLILPWKRQSMQ
ncbi:Hypothetical_protein [Hexamita inflata]|uniref:Hypothetical_protein n=1 Tax=Hexamita inflata TaxID=28002 RepID=A0ABP1H0F5_9EUKA